MSADIRKGDLVKFTHKEKPHVSVTTRILTRNHFSDVFYSKVLDAYIGLYEWDYEVLERPVDVELVDVAIDAYRASQGFRGDLASRDRKGYRREFTPVVQAVLDHINKESK